MINNNRILEDLDKHAAEFNFPVLNNANIQFADARLTAFRGTGAWAIFFEVVGFSPNEVQFVDDIYAYGNCVYPEGIVGQRIPLSESRRMPLWNAASNECVADFVGWTISIGGQELSFSPTLREYADAGITLQTSGSGSIREIDILRFLLHRLGHVFFAPDKELLQLAPHCHGLSKFLSATEWQHPDVAGDEKPSQNPSMRSLVHAIVEDDGSLFDRGRANTDWKHWVEMGA